MKKRFIFLSGLVSLCSVIGMAMSYSFTKDAVSAKADDGLEIVSVGGNPVLEEPPTTSVTQGDFPYAHVGEEYSAQLVATGGSGSYTWNLDWGGFADGLSLNPDTGVVSGTPTKAIPYSTVYIRATDKADTSIVDIAALSFVVYTDEWVPTISTTTVPNATIGYDYNPILEASGGPTSSNTWTIIDGELPTGMELRKSGSYNAQLFAQNVTASAGSYTFTLKVENEFGSDTQEYTIEVSDKLTVSFPAGSYFRGNQVQFTASIGNENVTWHISTSTTDANTVVDENGLLTIGETEDGDDIYVVATSKTNPSNHNGASVKYVRGIGYDIIVIDGSAKISGVVTSRAAPGTTIVISPINIEGKDFKEWTVESGSEPVTFADSQATTSFTMPSGNVIVKANFNTIVTDVVFSFDYPVAGNHIDQTIELGSSSYTVAFDGIYHGNIVNIDEHIYVKDSTFYRYFFAIYPTTNNVLESQSQIRITVNGQLLNFDDNYEGTKLGGGQRWKVDYDVLANDTPSYSISVTDGTVANSPAKEGDTVTITAKDAPSGKVFDKWLSEDVEFANQNASTTTFTMPNKAVSVTATYRDIVQYTVSFNANGGTGSISDQLVTEGNKITLPANSFTAPAHKQFKCWMVNEEEKAVGSEITIAGNTTVYAVWENVKHTISFNADGGTGTMYPIEFDEGENYTLPGCGYTPQTGKRFTHWTINSFSTKYYPGNIYNIDQDILLTAHYEDIPVYTVIFDNGGGTGVMAPVNVNDGEEYTLPNSMFAAPTNKEFSHWSVNSTNKNPGDKIVVNDNVTVTAIYKYIERTVSFNAGNGSGTMDPVKVNQGSDYVLPANGFTAPANQEFKAWLVGTEEKAPGTDINITGDIEITALYKDILHQVTFNKGEGSGSMDPVNVKQGSEYTLPNSGFTAPINQEFKAWLVGTEEKAPGSKITITEPIAITALYKDIIWTVSFDANGGTGTMAQVEKVQGQNYTLPANGFTAPDHKQFDHWSVGGVDRAPGYVIEGINSNITVTAVYVYIPHQVTFLAGEGTGSMAPVDVYETQEYTLPESTFTVPTNKEFKSWSVGGENKNPGEVIVIEGDTEITAVYGYNVKTITFNAGEGSGVMAEAKADQGSNYSLPACTFTAPVNKEFKAWLVGTEEKAVGEEILISDNIEITALYKNIVRTITFNAGEGSGEMSPVNINQGENYTLPANGFTAPTNKEFKCWSVGGVEKAPGEAINITDNVEVTALYKNIIKTVTFDAGEGTGEMAPVNVNQGSEYTLPDSGFTAPANKEFKSWVVDGVGKAAGDKITITGDVGIVAHYEYIKRTISFNANGGTGTMASVNVDQGSSYTLPNCGFTAPSGKQFKTWTVDGVTKAPGVSITVTGDIVIVATYEDIPAPQEEIVSGGASIKFSDGTSFSGTVTLNVETKKTTTSEAVKSQLKKNEEIVAVIDIKLLDGQTEIQPGKAVTISVALPEAVDAKSFKIIHIHSEEDVSVVENFTVKDGVVSFEVDKLSEFAFVNVSKGFPGWAVALIVIGSILLLLGIGYCLLFFVFNKYIMQKNGKKIRAFVLPWFKKEDEFCVIDMCFRICYRKQEAIYQEK